MKTVSQRRGITEIFTSSLSECPAEGPWEPLVLLIVSRTEEVKRGAADVVGVDGAVDLVPRLWRWPGRRATGARGTSRRARPTPTSLPPFVC
jgi:hypothetical protein